jgi:hypothetical protein
MLMVTVPGVALGETVNVVTKNVPLPPGTLAEGVVIVSETSAELELADSVVASAAELRLLIMIPTEPLSPGYAAMEQVALALSLEIAQGVNGFRAF